MARLTRSSSHQPTSVDPDDLSQPDSQPPSPVRPRKFALVQHLPTGDWWSSVSSDPPDTDENFKSPKAYHTANADLVAVFPSPSGSDLAYKGTLGDYVRKRPQTAAPYRASAPRRVSCGKFLDYGPYASFAPSFDQDGVEVGRIAMGELVLYQTMRRRLRSLAKGKRRAFLAANDRPPPTTEDITQDVDMEGASAEASTVTTSKENKPDALVDGIESLLPPEEVSSIKAALGSLELEKAVEELEKAVEDLLQRNARALARLEELQMDRLRSQRGASDAVQVGSEEWQLAQGITDSLAVLASLRPRPSNSDSASSPLTPLPPYCTSSSGPSRARPQKAGTAPSPTVARPPSTITPRSMSARARPSPSRSPFLPRRSLRELPRPQLRSPQLLPLRPHTPPTRRTQPHTRRPHTEPRPTARTRRHRVATTRPPTVPPPPHRPRPRPLPRPCTTPTHSTAPPTPARARTRTTTGTTMRARAASPSRKRRHKRTRARRACPATSQATSRLGPRQRLRPGPHPRTRSRSVRSPIPSP
ncbi:hypothetical protein C8Q80DRAFT_104756 [Daedaleopsis nitida]|nr:hypothetical protein C8Q80DRAFT_104756 [Daedaleopsis nitida]